MKWIRKYRIPIEIFLAVFAALCVEVFLFGAGWFALLPEENVGTSGVLSTYAVENDTCSVTEDTVWIPAEGGYVDYENIFIDTKNVEITLEGIQDYVTGSLWICDESNRYEYRQVNTFHINPGDDRFSKAVMAVDSNGKIEKMKVQLEASDGTVGIRQILLNAKPAFPFHVIRFFCTAGVFLLIWAIVRFRWYQQQVETKNKKQQGILAAALLFCILFAIQVYRFSPYALIPAVIEYPLEKNTYYSTLVEEYGPYVQQFDSFRKGQLHSDVLPSKELEELDNVYDFSERKIKEIPYKWDASYYNGQYYFYFGIAPVILFYFPFYGITGALPSDGITLLFFSILSIIGIFMALPQVVKALRIKANFLIYLLSHLALVFGSLIYMAQGAVQYYEISMLSTLACIGFFLWGIFGACNQTKMWKKVFLYAIAGVSVVMAVLSRPSCILLFMGLGTPVMLGVLKRKDYAVSEKLMQAAAFLIPVAAGAAGIMYFNYVRFGSPLEFGLRYQLTVRDISYDSTSFGIKTLLYSFYYYFLMPFSWQLHFPYLSMDITNIVDYGRYIYNSHMAGLFAIPMNLGVLLLPWTAGGRAGMIRKNQDAEALKGKTVTAGQKKATYCTTILAVLVLMVINFCNAGVVARYLCDMSLCLGLAAVCILMELTGREFMDNKDAGTISRGFYYFSIFLLLATVFVGIMVYFSLCGGDIITYQPTRYMEMEAFFGII